ncbi:cyclic-AMP phosphodiesterase [Grosmannia clavigera kw1407]|uniref:Cyclic-AMP phosphodiesterase n=1 Tax=Grosmannia clavigera (strain kw1407 / UAMH 11150) TaxID=655863 RepID=F0XQB6_GROCL|nr:cyclic-AMP phosphodiesterase [Grosmannia clavigera kw1407]EFX00334.1 cyclic-AMP phosphodiesterase [Grosmannia clavigera kw1407]
MSHGKGADVPEALPSPALQVIVLGAGGGPQESNTTAFLVRSTAEGWRRGSIVALDAGVLLSSVTRILEQTSPADLGSSSSSLSLPHTLTSGPFAGLQVPNATAAANAAHIQSTLINTYLITHPHLDHIAGFVINTAGLPGSRPKRLAGLPSTISAFKQHIFNNVIWPNLSDENNGAGLITYMRLVDGGSPALGVGDGRGYVEISDGLAVKVWSVSHGHCIERHSHRGSGVGTRFGSVDAGGSGGGGGLSSGLTSPRLMARQTSFGTGLYSSPLAHQLQHQHQHQLAPSLPRRDSHAVLSGIGGGGAAAARRASQSIGLAAQLTGETVCVYDSSAYFIRDVATGREVLMFGDVEPDSVSLSPRNIHVWQEAAPKIAAGHLAAIFMECSYEDTHPVDRLYGHLTPHYVVEELASLAAEVEEARVMLKKQAEEQQQQQRDREGRKRKRRAADDDRLVVDVATGLRTGSHSRRKTESVTFASVPRAPDDPVSPRTVHPSYAGTGVADDSMVSAVSTPATAGTTVTPHISTPTADLSLSDADPLDSLETGAANVGRTREQHCRQPPLKGLKVVIIHVKETLKDGPTAGEVILEQLLDYEEQSQLGCEYIISYAGQSLYF